MITSTSSVNRRAVRPANMTRLATDVLSLQAGKNTLRPGPGAAGWGIDEP
jgi:hypothetical protein